MQSLALLAGVGLANALVMPRGNTCQTTFSVSGSISGSVGEISSGQARVGSGLKAETYNYDSSAGTLVDSSGRGCFFTPPTDTLQCDEGQNPTPGFSIGCDGQVSYKGQTTFYQCYSGTEGEYNLYLGANGYECNTVTIKASSCYSECMSESMMSMSMSMPPSMSMSMPPKTVTSMAMTTIYVTACPAQSSAMSYQSMMSEMVSESVMSQPMMSESMASASQPTSSQPTVMQMTPAKSGCPAELGQQYQYPHLIIPISKMSPNTPAGSSYFGEVSSGVASLFNFDIPSSYSGKHCKLEFLLPEQSQLQTSSYTLSGSGQVAFSSLKSPAVEGKTDYNNCPAKMADLGTVTVKPGNAYVVEEFACPAGQRVGYEMASVGGTSFKYFQDYNPCPIGLYIVAY